MDAELDQSTARQWSEGRSPLCEEREYPMCKHTPGPWGAHKHGFMPNQNTWMYWLNPNTSLATSEPGDAAIAGAGPELLEALEATTRELIGERDCLYESVSLPDGTVPDGEDQAGIAELDRVIDQARAAIKKAKGEQQ